MTVQVPNGFEIVNLYTVNGHVTLTGNDLTWHCGDNMCAWAVYLHRK